jgi:hypothetical protein
MLFFELIKGVVNLLKRRLINVVNNWEIKFWIRVFDVVTIFGRILCCFLSLSFLRCFHLCQLALELCVSWYQSLMIHDYCLLVVYCKTIMVGKGHKIKCVHEGGDKEIPSWEKNVQEMAIEDTQRHIVELTWRLVKKTQRE